MAQKPIRNLEIGQYRGVGGSSTHVLFNFPGYGALYMGSIETISYSTYRDKTPVYDLGGTNISGFALGKRYVAGSIIKTLFTNDDFTQFLLKIKEDIRLEEDLDNLYNLHSDSYRTYHHLLMDDVTPFDIIIVMSSEYGDWSVADVIYGATLINEGQIQSINDMVVQSTISFVANDAKTAHEDIRAQGYNIGSPKGILRASQIPDKDDGAITNEKDKIDYSQYNVGQIMGAIQRGELPASAFYDWIAANKKKKNDQHGNNPAGQNQNKAQGPTPLPGEIDVRQFTKANAERFVHDGDTIKFKNVKDGSGEIKDSVSIRLMLIDTPETKWSPCTAADKAAGKCSIEGEPLNFTGSQPVGKEAQKFLNDYIQSGKWDSDVNSGVVRRQGVDVYGRLLVVNPNYAEAVVKAGLAWPNVNGQADPNHVERINRAYKDARDNRRGLWGGDRYPISPSRWRNMSLEERERNSIKE